MEATANPKKKQKKYGLLEDYNEQLLRLWGRQQILQIQNDFITSCLCQGLLIWPPEFWCDEATSHCVHTENVRDVVIYSCPSSVLLAEPSAGFIVNGVVSFAFFLPVNPVFPWNWHYNYEWFFFLKASNRKELKIPTWALVRHLYSWNQKNLVK